MDTIEKFRSKRNEATSYIRNRINDFKPEYLVILGTGLGQLTEEVELLTSIDYDDIPHFPVSTVESHHGRLLFGHLAGKPVIAMQGRFHFYEGYSMQLIVFPVRVARALGVQTLIVSNACGGLNPNFTRGDIMLINDHINFLADNPLIGPNDNELGSRFPDMSEPYTKCLIETAETVALDLSIKMHDF